MSELIDPLGSAKRLAGGVVRLAEQIGVTPQAISQWKRVPAARVLAVEAATQGRVPRWLLRPDLYPPPAQAAA